MKDSDVGTSGERGSNERGRVRVGSQFIECKPMRCPYFDTIDRCSGEFANLTEVDKAVTLTRDTQHLTLSTANPHVADMAEPQDDNRNEGENEEIIMDASVAQSSAVDEPMSLVEFMQGEQKKAEVLSGIEKHWRDRYDMLLDHGYQLRKRMRPGWVPSWRDTQLHPNLFEDGYRHWVRTQRSSHVFAIFSSLSIR